MKDPDTVRAVNALR